jgi:hypothetical protein
MHNFRKLVAPDRKQDPREQAIIGELACHLEEMYMELLRGGASEESAFAKVSTAGKDLGPTIGKLRREREGGFRTWLRPVILPGLSLSIFYGICNMGLGVVSWEYPRLWREAGLVMASIALGFCAASSSRELGGNRTHRIWASASVISLQALAEFVMVFLVTPLEWTWTLQHLNLFVASVLWIFLWDLATPVVALVVGGLISVRTFSPRLQDVELNNPV